MRKKSLWCLAVCICSSASYVKAQTLDRNFFTTNGVVNATVQNNNTLYVGGQFSQLGYGVKKFARYTSGSTKPDLNFPQLDNNSTLNAIEPDGSGGYYLGGYITNYNGIKFNQAGSGVAGVIHVLADYSLDAAFLPTELGGNSVTCLKKLTNRLYIGGVFSSVNGTLHSNFAALNAGSGTLVSWTPDEPDLFGSVQQLEATNSYVFMSGNFSSVGGNSANGFAALNAATGKFTRFISPGVPNAALKIKNNKLYVASDFVSVGYPAKGVAKVSIANAAADAGFPETNGEVYCVLYDGNGGYYIGGNFTHVGNTAANYLAHILSNGAVDPAFNANVNGIIYCLASDGANLYFGGSFGFINGNIPRRNAAAVSLSTGLATSWDPSPDGSLRTMVYSGGTIYMGGYFTNVKATARNYAAAVTTANTLTAWAPDPDWYINQIVPNSTGTSFFICGGFTTVKGTPHLYVAKVNSSTGNPATWNPSPNGYVYSIALNGSRIYLGGGFSSVNGQARAYLAEVDTALNIPTGFQADANDLIFSLNITSGKLYAGGYFTIIKNTGRNYCARIDLSSQSIDPWNPGVNKELTVVASGGANIILGGDLFQVNGADRNHIAAIDLQSNQITSFNPVVVSLNGTFNTLYFSGSELFAGGNIGYYSDSSFDGHYYGLLALDTANGGITRIFDYTSNYGVAAITSANNRLFIGGNLNTLIDSTNSDNVVRNFMATYDLSNNKLTSEIYDPNNTVRLLLSDGSGGVLAAGDFTLTNYVNRNFIAALNLGTGQATNWNPYIDGYVYAMALRDTALFIGGSFFSVHNSDFSVYANRQYLAAISTNSGLPMAWNADLDNYPHTLTVADTILFVGGNFSNIKGVSRNNAAALGTGGTGAVKAWAPNPNNMVRAIVPAGTSVYIGGDFTTIKGSSRNFLASVSNSTGNLNPWNPNPNAAVYSIAVAGATLYTGGNFTIISGQNRRSLAAYAVATNSLTGFNPSLNNTNNGVPLIYSLASYGRTLFIGSDGGFTTSLDSIKGAPRRILAGVDTTNGNATAFNPSPDYAVNTIKVSNNRLVTGGQYTSLGISAGSGYFNVFNLEPSTRAAALNFTNVQATSVTANWTNGNGEGRLVVVRDGSPAALPADGVAYNANAAFGQGSAIGNSFVVYRNSGNSVNVTNLQPGKTYYFAVYEYNGNGSAAEYLQTPYLTGNITTPCAYSNIISPPGPLNFCDGDSATLTALPGMASYAWSTGASSQSIVVKSAGSYTVTVTDSYGCGGTSNPVVVTLKPKPSPTTTPSGNVNINFGGNVTISVNGTYNSYLWSTGATTQSIVVSSPGSYTVTVTAANGCPGTSAPVTVSYNCVKPTISSSGSTSNVCPGKTVTLTSSPGPGYLWSTGATTQSIVVNAAGSYTVTTAAGCTSDPTVVTYQACARPTNPVANNITATGARLSWTPPASCAIGYQLQYRRVGTATFTTLQFVSNIRNLTSLTPNTTYEWKVQTGCQQTPPIGSGNINGPNFTTAAASVSSVRIKEQKIGTTNIKLFPNPAHDYAIMQLNGEVDHASIKLTNITGKILWQKNNINTTQLQIPVSKLSDGTYFVTVTSGKEQKVLKLVKE